MPRHEPGAVRFLDEEMRRPTEQVRPQHVLGCIDDPGVMDELVDPREEQMRLVPPVPLQGRTGGGLMLLQMLAVVRDRDASGPPERGR